MNGNLYFIRGVQVDGCNHPIGRVVTSNCVKPIELFLLLLQCEFLNSYEWHYILQAVSIGSEVLQRERTYRVSHALICFI